VVRDRCGIVSDGCMSRPFSDGVLDHFPAVKSESYVDYQDQEKDHDGHDEREFDQRLATLAMPSRTGRAVPPKAR
jgi:hypothetical protein